MASNQLTSRGSARGGRFLAAAAALLVVLQATQALAGQPATNLTVREDQGVYRVTARFLIDQPRSAALAVLTDYEEIPRFMPDVRTSVVRERAVGRVVVEQEAVSGVMMFSKRVHLVLEIEEQLDALIFRDRSGRSFVRYEGAWRLSEQDGQTAITYELTAEPSFDVPGFMIKRIVRRDAAQMIDHLQREIAARAARGAGVSARSRR
jgi:ribosome-associated toxin RatA of RatAB toxin-antitoxin module